MTFDIFSRWVRDFLFEESLYFCVLGADAKFYNPRTIPSGRKVKSPERRKEKKRRNNTISSGHYVLPPMPNCSARILFGPFIFFDPGKMKCMCDSGLAIVLFITLALLCCVAWLLFSDFSGPCDQASAGTTVSSLMC